MVEVVLTTHFQKKVRATIGLVPLRNSYDGCIISTVCKIWERNGQIKVVMIGGSVVEESSKEKQPKINT